MIKIKHKNCSIQVLCCKKSELKNNIVSKFAYLFIPLLVFISCISRTQTKDDAVTDGITEMSFKQKEYKLGNVPSGKSVSALFKFSNTGKNSLLIEKVTTSCGCTVAQWPKDIIKPNEKGKIKIVYDAKNPGRFNKAITVFYNGKNSPQILSIKGEVIYPETDEEANIK